MDGTQIPEPVASENKKHWWQGRRKWIVIVPIVVIALGLGLFAAISHQRGGIYRPISFEQTPSGQRVISNEEAIRAGKQLSHQKCEGEGPVTLTHSPMDLEDFTHVIPYGLMIGDHVTPIDHQYFAPLDYNSPRDAYEVYAMADGVITEIGRRVGPPEHGRIKDEYRLVFTETCTFFYYYDLVTSLAPDLQAAFDQHAKDNHTRDFAFPVKAGQLIGRIGGQTLDFAVWDTKKPLSGLLNPESYSAEAWKVYTADPLDYYSDELKKLLLSRYIREVEPRSGRIDYDEAGKLIGNWFVEGTNGYYGIRNGDEVSGSYARTHLAIAPEHLDPSTFLISMGDFKGHSQQFATKTNTPWPSDVTESSGLIKYELVEVTYRLPDGSHWDRKSGALGIKVDRNGPVKGTVLVQLLEEGSKLKFEAFPGKTVDQVTDFTPEAKIYTR